MNGGRCEIRQMKIGWQNCGERCVAKSGKHEISVGILTWVHKIRCSHSTRHTGSHYTSPKEAWYLAKIKPRVLPQGSLLIMNIYDTIDLFSLLVETSFLAQIVFKRRLEVYLPLCVPPERPPPYTTNSSLTPKWLIVFSLLAPLISFYLVPPSSFHPQVILLNYLLHALTVPLGALLSIQIILFFFRSALFTRFTLSSGPVRQNGTVPLGCWFCHENDLPFVLKQKGKGDMYGEQNGSIAFKQALMKL